MIIRCAYADVSGGQVHYRIAGASGPYLVCFHQTPLSSKMFERALPLLGTKVRMLAFDTPGYGGSSPLEGAASIPGYAARIVEAIDILGIERTAVCGFATGAVVAAEVARMLGARASHLILSSTPVLTEERLNAFGLRLSEAEMTADGSHLMHIWESRVDNYGVGNDLDQVQMAVTETLRAFERMDWGLTAVGNYDLERVLSALRLPALFLTAEHDRLAPENQKAVKLVPGAREVFLKDVHPQVCWTDPSRFRDEVFRFLGLS